MSEITSLPSSNTKQTITKNTRTAAAATTITAATAKRTRKNELYKCNGKWYIGFVGWR